MAGNNYNLKGGYVQQGKIYTGQIKGDIAFVYSRLKTNDVIFGGTTGYTTENRSWRRVIVKKDYPQKFESGRAEGYCCIECPDNGGDYTTKQNCLDGVSDRKNSPQIDNSLNNGGIEVFLIFLLCKHSNSPYDENTLIPTYLSTGDKSSLWQGGLMLNNPFVYLNPVANQAASTALIVPPSSLFNAKGKIGWCGALPQWKAEVWNRHRDSILYFGWGEYLSYGNPSSPESTPMYHDGASTKEGKNPFFYNVDWPKSQGDNFFTTGDYIYSSGGENDWCSNAAHYRQAITRANERVLADPFSTDSAHLIYNGTKYLYPDQNVPYGVLGSTPGPDGYYTAVGSSVDHRSSGDIMAVVWKGTSTEAGSAPALMSSIAAYWGFEKTVFCGGHTFLQGCFKGSDIGGNPNNLERPNPDKITWGEIKGRKSEVILNFQDLMGTSKELVLPVEFSSRPTHIRFEDPDFYSTGTSGWLPRDIWCGVEWFDSRISMTKDDIFVDILYELVQEWEPVGGTIKLLMSREQYSHELASPPTESYHNVCGNYSWTQFLTGSADLFYGYSRPKRTRFNKIKSFKINKKSFSVTGTATYTYPATPSLSQETFHNKLIKNYTLLDYKTYDDYWDWYEVKFADGLSSETYEQDRSIKIPYLPNSSEYLGLPLVYPQQMFDPDQFGRANDFIKPQSSWTELDWLFWELLERPSKTNGVGSYVEFLKNGKFGFHGRTQKVTTSRTSGGVVTKTNSPFAYYVRQPSGIGIGMSLNVPDYYLKIAESERLRGNAKIDDLGKIVKWWRISPISFPVIMTGGEKSNNSNVH